MENITKKKEILKSYLSNNHICEDFSIPLFASFLQLNPPIFVDININIKPNIKLLKHSTSSSLLSINEKNRCFTEITNILGITDLPLASYKSTNAKTHIFW